MDKPIKSLGAQNANQGLVELGINCYQATENWIVAGKLEGSSKRHVIVLLRNDRIKPIHPVNPYNVMNKFYLVSNRYLSFCSHNIMMC